MVSALPNTASNATSFLDIQEQPNAPATAPATQNALTEFPPAFHEFFVIEEQAA